MASTSRMRTVRRTIAGIPGVLTLWKYVRRTHHELTLRFARRTNHLYTQFCRVPAQLDALVGPVYDLVAPHLENETLRIVLFGSSSGAEPYSISWTLQRRLPHVRFQIECYDIDPAMVALARAGHYAPAEVFKNKLLPSDFVATALDQVADGFVVKPHIAAPVQFHVGDVLSTSLVEQVAPADIVFAQNFLFHLSRPDAALAVAHLAALLKPTAALFIDGSDLDIRSRATADAKLQPLMFQLERIHEQALIERGDAWPEIYWGLEQFDRRRKDQVRRYATIFLRTPQAPPVDRAASPATSMTPAR